MWCLKNFFEKKIAIKEPEISVPISEIVPELENDIEDIYEKVYNNMLTVILDNGHGENTPGKRSPVWDDGSQLFEYEFNRDIVLRIYQQLFELNIPCIILVPELNDISLTERCKRVNKIYDETEKKCFLFSIHANAGGGTGWECHIYSEKTKSKDYATILAQEAKNEFGTEWKVRQPLPNQLYWVSNFQIIRDSKCPAVLTENFFMDKEEDCRFIMSEEGRDRIAKIHVETIKKIIS